MKNLILIAFLTFLHLFTIAQFVKEGNGFNKNDKDQSIFEEGEYWFELHNYNAAYAEYIKLIENYPDEQMLNFRIGVCELFFPHKWTDALTHLQKVSYEKFKKTEYPFYLACAYHVNLKFDEAITEFNNFIKGKYGTKQMKEEARFYIKNCEVGKKLVANPVPVTISNIGAPINTVFSEYVPIVSADQSTIVFTYRGEKSIGGKQFVIGKKNANTGEYFEDIMISQKDSVGNWKEPLLLNTNINTTGNDACVALSHDANTLIMFRSIPGDLGTLYTTQMHGTDWNDPELIPGKVNSPAWEGSISVSPNGKFAYFASERNGGKGGRDIYFTELLADGTWGNIKNAGDSINTIYDDDAPYYHPSGQFLLICSRGHESMGGFDIFRCDKINDSTWSKPKNLGYPINTPGEDIYYSLSSDGKKGFYSSGKAGGFGMQDIYVVEPGLPGIQIKLLQILGTITLNERPVEATIEIAYSENDKNFTNLYSKSTDGKYVAELPSGFDYRLTYKLNDLEPQIRNISSKDVSDFLESTIDVQFYTPAYLEKIKKSKDSLDEVAKKKEETANLVQQYSNSTAEGLEFRVQIGAYNLPQNFNYSSVMRMNKVEKLKLEDNITRFVMGKFNTYNEAAKLRDQVIAAGITDAFITAIYKGKRVYIVDLVQQGIFKK